MAVLGGNEKEIRGRHNKYRTAISTKHLESILGLGSPVNDFYILSSEMLLIAV